MRKRTYTKEARKLQPFIANIGGAVVENALTAGEGPGIDVLDAVVGIGLDSILLAHSDGSPATEYETITAALAAASSGDVVWIARAGSFTESVTVPAGVSVVGLDRARCAITGDITLGDGAALEALTVTGSVTGPDTGTGYIYHCDISGDVTAQNGDLVVEGGSIAGAITTGGGGTVYTAGDEIATGSVDGNNESGVTISGLTVGTWYALEATGGPFYHNAELTLFGYDFQVSVDGSDFATNAMGWIRTSTGDVYKTIMPSWGSYLEDVDGRHARLFFRAPATSIKYRVENVYFADNSGTLGYSLKNATVTGGRVRVSAVQGGEDGIPIQGDRSAWDALDYPARHANDIDDESGIHHTLAVLDERYSQTAEIPVVFTYSEADIGNPPTEADLIGAFGSPSTDQRGQGYIVNDAGAGNNFYLCLADGGYWWFAPMVRAVAATPSVTVDSSGTVIAGGTDWYGRASIRVVDETTILVYRMGSAHAVNDGALHIRFSDDYGTTWTDEDTTLTGAAVTGFPMNPPDAGAGEDAGEPQLYVAPNGDLLLHMWRVDYGVSLGGSYQSRSTDGGKTWSTPAAIDFTGITDDTKVFSTDDEFTYNGVIYAGARVYSEADGDPSQSILIKSTDNGATWELVSVIQDTDEGGTGGQEVGIEYLGSNTIIAMLRDNAHTHSYKRVSTDMGATWGTLTDVTSTVGIAGRQRVYTRSHLRGGSNWWQDPVLIMTGFVHQVSGDSQSRRNAVWISQDRGATWSTPFYIDSTSEDAGYGDIFYNPTTDQYIVVNYQGTLLAADLKQYKLTIGGI